MDVSKAVYKIYIKEFNIISYSDKIADITFVELL